MRRPWATWAPDGAADGAASTHPKRGVSRRPIGVSKRGVANGSLSTTILTHLPIAVAVIDADARLVFWNPQAASLFGTPPSLAVDCPPLVEILTEAANFTPQQRERVIEFVQTHIEAGDRTEPDSLLRILLGRDRRVALQVRGIGSRLWLVVLDEGKAAPKSGLTGIADGPGDASLDPLTGLSNRRLLNQVLNDLAASTEPNLQHALLMIDLDRFKPVNDTLGHPVGDALLCLVARRLRREIREEDLLVRLGGDEFVILMANGDRAEQLAARVVDVLCRPFVVEGHVANIGASVGIAWLSGGANLAVEVMRHADLALYDAKSAGRGTWRVFNPAMAAAAQSRRDLETDLRKAMILGEMSLVYQPQLNVRTRELTGFEALLRWNHPTRGMVPPAVFIPVAEEIGCIAALGEWVLKTACREATRWPTAMSVAVNVSPRQLEDSERFYQTVQAALRISELAPNRLELEITESSLLSPDALLLANLHRLHNSGIRFAMDDFGTGYSSLSQLRSFPFSKIKIDQSFVAKLGLDAEAAAVIRAIAALGAGLGMTTIAEGVETQAQAVQVEAGGCTDIQGYLISRPVPAAEIEALLRHALPGSETTTTE